MKRFIYILLSLCLTFNTNAQVTSPSFYGAYHIAIAGGITYDTDAQAYFTACEAQGYTFPAGWKDEFDDFYTGCKADGFTFGTSGNIRSMHMLAHGDFAANKVNMVTPSGTFASSSGSPTSGADGVILNGSTQFVDIGVAPNLATQNGLGFGCYVQAESETNSGRYLMGARTTSSRISGLNYGISPDRTFAIPSTSATFSMTYSGGHAIGAILCNRTSSTSSALIIDATVEVTSATTSTTPATHNFYIGATNNAGTAQSFNNCVISAAYVTDGLDNTEAIQFLSRVKTLLTNTAGN